MEIPDIPVTTTFAVCGVAMIGLVAYANKTQRDLVQFMMINNAQQRKDQMDMHRFTLQNVCRVRTINTNGQ